MLVTALVTPFVDDGARVDLALLERLVAFQLERGADLVLLAGTTGEGASLDESERLDLVDAALGVARPEQLMVSIGGGRVEQVVARGQAVLRRGVRNLLLADCPYSGASSQALRTHWHGAAAAALGDARLFPYAVPGRTGTEMLPDDLARLAEEHPGVVVGVKDATGRLARMGRVRELCGDEFTLLCGDDHMLRDAMVDPRIRADGAASFSANLAPASMAGLVAAGRRGDAVAARGLHAEVEGLTGLVTVTVEESVQLRGERLAVPSRARNPVPLKAAFACLGMALGGCRAPLGEMGAAGVSHVRDVLRRVVRAHPQALAPLAAAFDLDLVAQLDLTPRGEPAVIELGAHGDGRSVSGRRTGAERNAVVS